MRGGWFGVKWVVFENFDRKGMLGAFMRGLIFAGLLRRGHWGRLSGCCGVGGLQWNYFK